MHLKGQKATCDRRSLREGHFFYRRKRLKMCACVVLELLLMGWCFLLLLLLLSEKRVQRNVEIMSCSNLFLRYVSVLGLACYCLHTLPVYSATPATGSGIGC